jgi:hypothetical protein
MRLPRTLRRRPVKQWLSIAAVLFSVFDVSQVLRCRSGPATELEPPTPRAERVYIASIHWNNEHILRSHWNNAVVALAKALGPENVFVTVYESGSWDNSKSVLRELDIALGKHNIDRNITLSDTTHRDELLIVDEKKGAGWIETPRGKKELRRIPYLSRLRNWTLEPLKELSRQGKRFDKVLFLNDVVFTVCFKDCCLEWVEMLMTVQTEDVLRLLDTNDGEYAAACSLDFSRPPQFYDTFALRDADGHEMLMQTWPYFRARASRRALLANRPTPVTSCWNGMGNSRSLSLFSIQDYHLLTWCTVLQSRCLLSHSFRAHSASEAYQTVLRLRT